MFRSWPRIPDQTGIGLLPLLWCNAAPMWLVSAWTGLLDTLVMGQVRFIVRIDTHRKRHTSGCLLLATSLMVDDMCAKGIDAQAHLQTQTSL
jgi:hypothetical protein